MSLALYWHTARHLRPGQIVGRALHRIGQLRKPAPDLSPAPPLRRASGVWVQPARRRPSQCGPSSFVFLNEARELQSSSGWDDPSWPLLWRYNLHYFDDLNAVGGSDRIDWHRALIERWIRENPPPRGTGWDPYPTSLRIVNWVKWACGGGALSEAAIQSLAVQSRHLAQRPEYHLLGNHLFVNAKALVFAGLFFGGQEAVRWLEEGLRILQREVPEQILPDGGQFERSPMYHALALEDMLDLQNLMQRYPEAVPDAWRPEVQQWLDAIPKMRRWLAAMCHPDGEISFFNDAAFGIAPTPEEIEAYAGRLGHPALPPISDGVVFLEHSGYLRVQRGALTALLDCAAVGPDYQPGHAHADTLSFELSWNGRRLIVNSGTSCYGTGAQRQFERSTAAHSTVEVDGQSSSETWGGFRVARRARPLDLVVDDAGPRWTISAAHDGYRRLPGRVTHRRLWEIAADSLTVRDSLAGKWHSALARFYLHPDWAIEGGRADGTVAGSSIALVHGDERLQLRAIETALQVAAAHYHPEFGVSVPSRCLFAPVGPAGLTTCFLAG